MIFRFIHKTFIRLFLCRPSLQQGIPILLALVFMFGLNQQSNKAIAQDTVRLKNLPDTSGIKVHSPKKATYYAMILPGLGQAYNHKYWKIPIVYAGFGTMAYFISFNTKNYRLFRDAYAYTSASATNNPTTLELSTAYVENPSRFMPMPQPVAPPNDLSLRYSKDQLLVGREYYRRNLEVSYIVTGVWYILTVVDATVDAHFFDYNISDDLSMNLNPWITPPSPLYKQGAGLMLTFKF